MKLLLLILGLASAAPNHEIFNVIGCGIYGMDTHAVFHRAEDRCLFLDDGSLIASRSDTYSFYRADKTGKILWRHKIHSHHQMNFDLERKHVLLLTGKAREFNGRKIRFDRIEKYDLDGKLISAFDFFKNHKLLIELSGKKPGFVWTVSNLKANPAPFEFLHTNSVYEIPDNPTAAKIPAFQKGNFIVDVNGLELMFILDKKLEKILWHLKQKAPPGEEASYHDVQVLPSGKMLIYNNRAFEAGVKGKPFGAIEEFDPVTGETVTLYKSSPTSEFAPFWNGGVQLLQNGNILISDTTRGGRAFEVDRSGKTVWSMNHPVVDPVTNRPTDFQQVKRLDLREFLKHNRGL